MSFGPKTLFKNVNLQLNPGQICGLVGKNGTGKTTLFKIIMGLIHSEQGDCSLPNNCLISYIEQEVENHSQELIEYVLLSNHIYSNNEDYLPEYYQLRPNAEKLLTNLGFKQEELTLSLNQFSGGWQMRANLAKALFSPSDILLLDEPTNHLDIETVMWLEDWLKSYRGLALIISHDREFLDNVTNYTINIANREIKLYSGNYSTYERTRYEHEQQTLKAQEKSLARIAHLQSFVDRFKAKASKAKQAQSRVKMIEKLQFSQSNFHDKSYSIEFFTPEYNSNLILSLLNAEIGYPSKSLIKSAKLQIFNGDRIGILGKNGQGKTTLIKSITNSLPLINGTLEINPKIKIGYFAQQMVEALSDTTTPYSLIFEQNRNLREQEILNYLGRYGFDAKSSRSDISKFSGGEKARLILAAIILTKPNIIFLDEPTNHLDIDMREELVAALNDFSGAVVLVSHDKFFLQSIVDNYYLIADGKFSRFDGDLEDYHQYLNCLTQASQSQPVPKNTMQGKKPKNKIEIQHS